jgi:hypothetical protein
MEGIMKLSRVIAFIAICTGLVFAQATTTPASSTPPAGKAAAPAKAKDLIARGEVVSVDAIANTLIIKTKAAEDTFSVNADTKILSAGKAIAIGDLKTGAKVKVTYKNEEGKKVALKVTEEIAKAAAAPKKEPAAPPAK